ncbi:hypothetical protein VHARVF571_600075 [Vibrio harveyi]|nr:hypothetical protein VHARVF571_600075 [Vibrio harveyi]
MKIFRIMKAFKKPSMNCAYFEQINVIILKYFCEMKAISKCE